MAGVTTEEQVTNGGLLATFLGEAATIDALALLLRPAFGLEPRRENFWSEADGDVWMLRFLPGVNGDTTALQVAQTVPNPVAAGWQSARERLEAALDETLFAAHEFWGYTLVYQAELADGADPHAAMGSLKQAACRLHAGPEPVVPVLAEAAIPGGRLWLTEIPMRDGAGAASVYLALGPASTEAELRRWLAGPDAPLVPADVVAHKGYYLRRDYHRYDGRHRYLQTVEKLTEETSRILDDLGSDQAASEQLDAVAHLYDRVVAVVPLLDRSRIDIITQLTNFDLRTEEIEGGEGVLAFHRRHLATALRDLELLVMRGRDAMEAAGTTVDMVQARLSKTRARQERRLESLLAFVAVTLALVELITMEAAGAFLDWLRPYLGRTPLGDYPVPDLFWTQVVLIVAVGAVLYLFIRLMLRLPERRQRRRGISHE